MAIRHVLSFGGGVNSVALMVVLLREEMPFDEAVFADTGGEVPETYEYLETARQYLVDHEVPLTVVSKRGRSLYDTAWDRRVFPSAIWAMVNQGFQDHADSATLQVARRPHQPIHGHCLG